MNAADALMEMGAKEVHACCTHGVLSGPAFERIEKITYQRTGNAQYDTASR